MSATTLMTATRVRSKEASSQRGSGERWVRKLSVAALAVATWMLCTLAGGTWMFVQRDRQYPDLGGDIDIPLLYIGLALFACALLVPTLLTLLTQAARADLSGREQQLAVLRLVGATAGEVRGMMILEALRRALVGLSIGTVAYLASVPAWSALSFQGTQIGTWEMFTWWVVPIAWAAVALLAAGSVWRALQQVAVTPLGVTKRVPHPGQKVITTVCAVAAAIGLYIWLARHPVAPEADFADVLVALVVFIGFLVVNTLIAVGVIQIVARFSYRIPGAYNYVATRRVGRGAKNTWRRCSALFFVAFTAGVAGAFQGIAESEVAPEEALIVQDLPKGIAITVLFGAVLLVLFTLLTQALAVVEQKQLTKSLHFIGAAPTFHTKVAVREIGVPMVVAALLGFGQGALVGLAMVGATPDGIATVLFFGALIALALVGCVGAVVVSGRLREKVLAETGRSND
ncbi:hypothetical protein QP866_00940 [Corynebacterium imitans]|uniref:FtsX-like permease family protein n=1 Tax=Corynebacterium imitans TaxID=156978 RepID=UPI00254A5962|nr:FtsX-like permease family protein [Corynebacterium imitans]MDK8305299.1 hypothetical protein [Corynebacterium imitans]MDK8636400.1 hypothetical protein [Corynebacterium imitans]MDK8771598.1 hypothetical protein [Corynebacterium imitans]